MTVCSARPGRLASFADVVEGRRTLQTTQADLALRHPGVESRCPGRSVSVPTLSELPAVFSGMHDTERFVDIVHDAVVRADSGDGGVVAYDGPGVTLALKQAGLNSPPKPIELDPTTMEMPPPLTSGYIDDPINASNGNMIHREDDIAFPTIAAALNVTRTWNSRGADRPGAFGNGWSSVLDMRLDVSHGRVVARFTDGSTVAYEDKGDAWFAAGVPQLRLSRDGVRLGDAAPDDRGWVLQTDVMRRFLFDADGALTGWRVGVAEVAVARDAAGRIVALHERVTGRSLEVVWRTDGLVDRLVADDGRTVTYARDADGVLQRVVGEAGAVDYAWDGELLISVLDADGVAAFVNEYDGDDNKVVRQTSPFGRVSTYEYRESGLTVFSDAAGVVQAMRHDHLGNLTAIFDVDGSAMHIAYDDQRRVVRVTERDGATVRYRYEGDDLVERIDPDGMSQRWRWDDRHRLIAETDRTGAVKRFEYNTEQMAPSRVIGPDGAVTSQTLDDRGLPTEIVDPDGVVTHMHWDGDGQLLTTTDAFGKAITFDYDAHGMLHRITPPSGAPTVMDIERGRVVRTQRGDAAWEYRYTPAGRVCGGVEPGDIGWSATFGAHGALATFSDAEGSTVEFAYDAIGNVTTTTAPEGAVYRNVFDEVGRQIAAIDPTGATSTKRYDRRGRVVELTEPNGSVWKRRVDVLGRTISSTAPDGSETTWTYHPNGDVAAVIAPEGRAWRTEFDVAGRPITRIDPSGGRSVIEYTPAGRVASRTSPAGRTERFEYDAAGRLAAVTGFDGVRRAIDRDARGWIAAVVSTDPTVEKERSAHRVEYRWDDDYRLVGITASDAELGERVTTIRRDAGGRVLESVDPTGVTTRFEWDRRGLMASATDPAGGMTSYEYDGRGRLAGMVTPGGGRTSIGYGRDGRQNSVTDPAGVLTRLLREPNGYVVGARHADGSGWDRSLDAMGREIERVGTDATVAGRFGYDAAGRLTSATEPSTGVTVEFLWDDDDQIKTVRGPDGTRRIERDADGWVVATIDPDGVRTVYDRDARGRVTGARPDTTTSGRIDELAEDEAVASNGQRDRAGRLTIGRDSTVYRYDDVGRLAEIAPADGSPTRYTYSSNGLLATETGPAGRRTYRYDRAGRVVRIDDGTGSTAIDYDAHGRRRAETRHDRSSVVYRWDVFDHLVGIDRYDALEHILGSVEVSYDALGRPHLVDGDVVGYDPVSGLADRLGDTRLSNDDSADSSADHPLGGVPVGELWVLGVRALDPVTHQFLSPDPLLPVPASNGAASAYTSSWNDPINWADPTGMRPLSVEEFGQVMDKAEQSKLGAAWEAIKNDPWGTLAMVGVVAAGVGLCFVPGGQAIGAGILIGVAASAGAGIATGTFNPRLVALSGAIGAIPGGNSLRGAMTMGAATGAGETVAGSLINGQGFPSPQQLLLGTVAGTAGGGVGYGASQGLARLRPGASSVDNVVDDLTPRSSTAALDHTATPPTRPPDSPQYSVVYEAQLPSSAYPGRSDAYHFSQANRELHEQFQADPTFAAAVEADHPGIVAGVAPGPRGGFPRTSPLPDLTWHHGVEPGSMQLIPRSHHVAPGPVQESLHPGGKGGMATWGGGR